jgi:hypothetical protein
VICYLEEESFFLPSADSKVVCRRLRKHFLTPPRLLIFTNDFLPRVGAFKVPLSVFYLIIEKLKGYGCYFSAKGGIGTNTVRNHLRAPSFLNSFTDNMQLHKREGYFNDGKLRS